MFRGVPPVTSELLDLKEKERVYGYHTEKLRKSAPVVDTKKPKTVVRIGHQEEIRALLRQREMRACQERETSIEEAMITAKNKKEKEKEKKKVTKREVNSFALWAAEFNAQEEEIIKTTRRTQSLRTKREELLSSRAESKPIKRSSTSLTPTKKVNKPVSSTKKSRNTPKSAQKPRPKPIITSASESTLLSDIRIEDQQKESPRKPMDEKETVLRIDPENIDIGYEMDKIAESPRGKSDVKKARFVTPLISPNKAKPEGKSEEKRTSSIVYDVTKEKSVDRSDSAKNSFESQENHVSFDNGKYSSEEEKEEAQKKSEINDSFGSHKSSEKPKEVEEKNSFEESMKEESKSVEEKKAKEDKKEGSKEFDDDFAEEKTPPPEPAPTLHDSIQKSAVHVFATEPKTPTNVKEPIKPKENDSFNSFDDDESADIVKPNTTIIKQDFSDSAEEEKKQESKNSEDSNLEDIFSDM